MTTDVEERPLSPDQRQMLHVLVKRMLSETDTEKLKKLTEQIRRIETLGGASEQSQKAA